VNLFKCENLYFSYSNITTLSITLKLFKKSMVFWFWKVGTNPFFGFWRLGELVGCTQPFKNYKRKKMSLNPTPLPPTFFFQKRKTEDLYTTLYPLSKTKKTWRLGIKLIFARVELALSGKTCFVTYYFFNYTFGFLFWISSPIWPKLVVFIPT
jgi:hypothetical protein